MFIGGEGPNIETHSILQRKVLSQFKAHEKRVKAAVLTKFNTSEELHLITASNDGFIKLWRILVKIYIIISMCSKDYTIQPFVNLSRT